MGLVRIVLAENSIQQLEYQCAALSAYQDVAVVGTARNGVDALAMIEREHPDVVVCDMLLERMDGFALLEQLNALPSENRPYVIGLGDGKAQALIARAYQEGVVDYMAKPVHPELLYVQIQRLMKKSQPYMKPEPVPEQKQTMRESEYTRHAGQVLLQMGMPPHLNGYRFLKCAISLVAERPETMCNITRGVYVQVAIAGNTTPSCVERDIRNAIAITWRRGGNRIYANMFCRHISNRKPTNSELIAQVAEYIRLQ